MKFSWYGTCGKRMVDVTGAVLLLVVTSPFLLLAGLLLYASNKGKVFFFQQRPGLGARPFFIYKFKTMTDATGPDGKLLPDDERKTCMGNFIRKSSIDELLQLINVLRGDMSLIGPRPLLMEYLPHYSPQQARRHDVRPGITGLAQVKGRNAISWEHRFRYDVFYVDHLSLVFDLKILYWTLLALFRTEHVDFEKPVGEETKFRGSQMRIKTQSRIEKESVP